MPYFHFIDYIPWIGSTVTECLLLGIMLQRNLASQFPIFLASILFDVLREAALPIVGHFSAAGYLYSYWTCLPIEYTIGFGVMLEAYRHSHGADSNVPPKIVWLLAFAAVVLVGVAVFLILRPDVPTSTLSGLVFTLDRSIDLLRCGMLLFLCAFASSLGLSWRHHVSGIVLGLGIYAALGLFVAAVHAMTGTVSRGWLARVPHFAYFAATILWTVYLWKPEPVRNPPTPEELSLAIQLIRRYRWMLAQLWRLFLNDDRP